MTDKLLQPPLLENIRNYLLQADENQQIFLYVPYIKVEILKKLVDGIKNVTIITTWKIRDLKFGSSELKLYPFCKEHNYELYIHKTIHLKVYSVELKSAIVATGNISHGGLEGGNQECGVLVNELSSSDRMFLEEIKTNTVKIDDYIFDKISEKYDALSSDLPDKVENIDLVEEPKKDEFFKRSDLPMTRSVDDLIKGYENKKLELNYSEDEETNACIEHDLKTYEIEPNLSKEEFEKKLKHNFLTHPFTKKIDEIIEAGDYSGGAGWGTVRKWIRDHCTDVPLPRLWDLTKNTQTLYHWFEKLGNTDDYSYVVDVPGSRSERISKILKYENEVLQVLESPGYTIEEIKKIYEKLERGWYVHDEPSDLSEKENASKSNWHYKREADEKVAKMLSLSEEEIGERTSKGKLYKKIVSVISKLHDNGFIKMWYYESNRGTWSDGIWRLTDEGKREIQRRGLTKTNNNENPISQFKVHQFYHHEKIYQTISGIGAGGGIRPSRDFPIIVVFRRIQKKDEENVYDDKYDEKTGIFHYNARGSGGAEQLEISQNQEIVNAKENGKTIIFFNQHEYGGEYEYLGEVELVGTTTEKQLDNGKYVEKLILLLKPVA